MPLVHDFAVIKKERLNAIYQGYIFNNPDYLLSPVVRLDDNIILYINDSLAWTNGVNPFNQQSCQGLCYYGYTVFDNNTVLPFEIIINKWHELFYQAPKEFTLTGNWQITDDNQGEYEKFHIIRNELLSQLTNLIDLCKQVRHDDSLVLLHGGI